MNNFTYYNDEWNSVSPMDKETPIGNTSQPLTPLPTSASPAPTQ
jgi:hypothetical protein